MSKDKIVFTVSDDAYETCPTCSRRVVFLGSSGSCYFCELAESKRKLETVVPVRRIFGSKEQ